MLLTFPTNTTQQKRIALKVDELMAICDQLEQQQEQRDNLAEKFSRSIVSND
jgi:hypothetical protein